LELEIASQARNTLAGTSDKAAEWVPGQRSTWAAWRVLPRGWSERREAMAAHGEGPEIASQARNDRLNIVFV